MTNVLKHTIRDWKFYRYLGNWHKHPWISALMCKMGRHDYELNKSFPEKKTVELECWYCGHTKSTIWNIGF
jgi:hypothetical protein